MSDSIVVRVTLDAYDMASTGRQTQVYVQIPEVARASWLLPEDRFHGLQGRTWPEVLDVTHDYVTYGGAASNSSGTAAWKAVMEWLRDDANRDEMQAAYEQDQARRHPVARNLLAKVAELEAEREKLVRWHGEDSKTITRLVARVERRHAELVALRNDALNVRGSLAPADGDRKVPFELGDTLTPAVDWLIARVAELEAERHTTNEALDDAVRALRETQAAPVTVYRASHDSIVMGRYTTREVAREHCETVLRREIGDTAGDLVWIPDDGSDGSAEELSIFGPGVDEDGVPYDTATGYVVTPLEVAAAYDEGADE